MDKQVWGNNDLSVAELGECFRAAHDQLRIAKMEYIHELKAKAKTMEDKLVEADEKRVQQLAKREGLEKDVTRFKGFICATLRSRWVLEEMTAEMISTNVDDDDHIID